MIELPAGILPVRDLQTREVLYGARTTTFRYELLSHSPTTGIDSLIGFLDGVQDDGSLKWSAAASVKKSGSLSVRDIVTAKPGLTCVKDIDLVATRIRPVEVIDGLPEMPLGVYVITAAPEQWDATGRTYALELHDKSTVLEQDAIEETFTATSTDPVLEIVRDVIESAGERITVDGSDVRTLPAPLVWPAGTFKLRIVNDLLDAIGYNALWMDGVGAFRATPYVRPALRSIRYSMLNDAEGNRLQRELVDGPESIYTPQWKRDRDAFRVPNKVVAVQAASADAEPLSGVATNEDPASPFSFPSRGVWVTRVVSGVEVPDYSAEVDPVAATEAFLEARARQTLVAASAVQAAVSVQCLPIPVDLLDAVRFASTPAGVDARHTVQSVSIPLRFDGLMGLDLQEVVDL